MISESLLRIVRPRPSDTGGLVYAEGKEEDGMILDGKARSPATGGIYEIKDGYLDLLKTSTGADSLANLTNFLPGAGRGYEPLWRVRSLSLLTGEPFPNERELEIITRLIRPVREGRYLDLGCSAGLYTRNLSRNLDSGLAVGIDISPSMLREANRRACETGTNPSFVRANAKTPSFLRRHFQRRRLRRHPQRVRRPVPCPAGDSQGPRDWRASRYYGYPACRHAGRPTAPAFTLHGRYKVLRPRRATQPPRPCGLRAGSSSDLWSRLLRWRDA